MRNYLNNAPAGLSRGGVAPPGQAFLKSKQNNNMPIVKALLKYDQSNFSL
jgi:hypothetical protein